MIKLVKTLIIIILFSHGAIQSMESTSDQKHELDNQLYHLIGKVGRNIVDEAKVLIEAGAAVNLADQEGKTPLMRAANTADLTLCKLLLEKGASVHCEDKSGKTALYYAANESKACAELLVEAMLEAPIPGQAERMLTAMLCFSRMNQTSNLKKIFPPILRLLLKEERELNAYRKVTTLQSNDGTEKYLFDVQSHLLQKYFPRLVLKDKKTALMKMAARGNTMHCQLLLDHKVGDVNQATGLGTTALHEAAQNGRKDTCDFLISAGANVFCVNADNQTPLQMASDVKCDGLLQYKEQLETSELLVEKMIERAVNRQQVFDIVNNLSNDRMKTHLLQKYFINYNL